MSEVKKGGESQESLTPSTDLPKESSKNYDPETFKRILDEVKRLEAEDDSGNTHFLDDNDTKVNQYPEAEKLYLEDKKIFNLKIDSKIEKTIKLREILSEKISEIESLLTKLEIRKKQIEGKGDKLSFQGDLDTLFTKINSALFIAESIDDQESISGLLILESQAMNLLGVNQIL